MITLKIAENTLFDEKNEQFQEIESVTVRMEHSLRAISKWEARYGKPFLGHEMTSGEMLYYCYCMCVDEGIPPVVFYGLKKHQLQAVQEYLNLPMTATWFSDDKNAKPRKKEIITSELVYFWMSSYQINWEAQDWHFNRLMTLIRVCAEKNKPPKKIPKGKAVARQRALNAARRKKYGTMG